MKFYIIYGMIRDGQFSEKNLGSIESTVEHVSKNAHIVLTDYANNAFGEGNWKFKNDASIPGGLAVCTQKGELEGDTISLETFAAQVAIYPDH